MCYNNLILQWRDTVTFGEWLDKQLIDHDWSMSKFGQLCGVSHVAVSRWISGERTPEPESCERIAKVFGIPVEDIYRRVGYSLSPTDLDANAEAMLHLFRNLPESEQDRVLTIMRALSTMHATAADDANGSNDTTKGE